MMFDIYKHSSNPCNFAPFIEYCAFVNNLALNTSELTIGHNYNFLTLIFIPNYLLL
jgi:hypothetical protein